MWWKNSDVVEKGFKIKHVIKKAKDLVFTHHVKDKKKDTEAEESETSKQNADVVSVNSKAVAKSLHKQMPFSEGWKDEVMSRK